MTKPVVSKGSLATVRARYPEEQPERWEQILHAVRTLAFDLKPVSVKNISDETGIARREIRSLFPLLERKACRLNLRVSYIERARLDSLNERTGKTVAEILISEMNSHRAQLPTRKQDLPKLAILNQILHELRWLARRIDSNEFPGLNALLFLIALERHVNGLLTDSEQGAEQ